MTPWPFLRGRPEGAPILTKLWFSIGYGGGACNGMLLANTLSEGTPRKAIIREHKGGSSNDTGNDVRKISVAGIAQTAGGIMQSDLQTCREAENARKQKPRLDTQTAQDVAAHSVERTCHGPLDPRPDREC